MAFKKIISVDIEHEYFNGGSVPGMYFKPTAECERLLRNHRLLVKNTNQLVILCDSDAYEKGFKPDAALAFDFLIYLPDNSFYRYTTLTEKSQDELYTFTNKADSVVLGCSVASRSGDAAIVQSNPFGVLKLYFNFPGDLSSVLKFEAKQLRWKYYILSNTNLAEPVIEGSMCGITFKKQTKNGQEKDMVREKLVTGFPDALISVFESADDVKLNNVGKKNIRLKNASDSRILIGHLPNPDVNENGIKIINLLN